MDDYKVGTWVKNKQTKQVYKIESIFHTNDGYVAIGVYKLISLEGKYASFSYDRYNQISDEYELCPAAQLLHGVK